MYQSGIHFNTGESVLNFSPIELALESETDLYSRVEKRTPMQDHLNELVRGNIVVELGASSHPQRCLFHFDPLKYLCIEYRRSKTGGLPNYVEYVNGIDAVSYLEGIPDQSVVVVSSLLFDNQILCHQGYAKELVQLIFNKTIPNGLSLHTFKSGFETLFIDQGFKFVFGRHHSKILSEEEVSGGYTSELGLEVANIFFRKPQTPFPF